MIEHQKDEKQKNNAEKKEEETSVSLITYAHIYIESNLHSQFPRLNHQANQEAVSEQHAQEQHSFVKVIELDERRQR